MADDAKIEAIILEYVQTSTAKGEFATRFEAIRAATGEMPVMPSVVAKVLDKMVEGGVLGQRVDGLLSIKRKSRGGEPPV